MKNLIKILKLNQGIITLTQFAASKFKSNHIAYRPTALDLQGVLPYNCPMLFILVQLNPALFVGRCSKYWKFRYRFDGREKKVSFGPYPEVTLAHARKKCSETKALLSDDIDPSVHRSERRLARQLGAASSFDLVAFYSGTQKTSLNGLPIMVNAS